MSVVLEDNQQLNSILKEFNLPKKEFITIPSPSGESTFLLLLILILTELNAYMMYPPNFDKEKKYPGSILLYSV